MCRCADRWPRKESKMIPVSGLRNRSMEREVRAQEAFPTAGLRGEEARGQTSSLSSVSRLGRQEDTAGRERKSGWWRAGERSAVQGQVEKAVLAGSTCTQCYWGVRRENRPWIWHPGSS